MFCSQPDFTDISVKWSPHIGEGWDGFARSCGGSFYCSEGYLAAARLTRRVHFFEFFCSNRKIGQCAVARPRAGRTREWAFLDAILLLPNERPRWPAAMAKVLELLGPGNYRYGSVWNTAPSCTDALRSLPGVVLLESRDFDVQAVDFSAWTDWTSYHRAMSANARRNAAKALGGDPGIRIDRVAGLPSLRGAIRIILMRRETYRRKGEDVAFRETIQFFRRMAILRRYVVIYLVYFRGRCTAFSFGLQFGGNFYYLYGASLEENFGSAWYLLTEALHRTHADCPAGKFVMGCDPPEYRMGSDPQEHPASGGWLNVLRQRDQCRARRFPTSIVEFNYRGRNSADAAVETARPEARPLPARKSEMA